MAGIFGAVGSLFGVAGAYGASQASAEGYDAESLGYGQEAAAFQRAAIMEAENAVYAKASGDIQDVQIQRQLYKSMSGTRSDLASGGLATSGSGIDVLRSSAEQGALKLGLNDIQTSISVNNYTAQEESYYSQSVQAGMMSQAAGRRAGAARAAGTLAGIAGLFGVAQDIFLGIGSEKFFDNIGGKVTGGTKGGTGGGLDSLGNGAADGGAATDSGGFGGNSALTNEAIAAGA